MQSEFNKIIEKPSVLQSETSSAYRANFNNNFTMNLGSERTSFVRDGQQTPSFDLSRADSYS